MLVESEPEFWDSAPFRESLRDGAFLQLDPAFFARELAVRIRWTQVKRCYCVPANLNP